MTEKPVKESYDFGVDTKAKLYTKTTVDDIIGLVKTDEITNSVALKKEAQLSICEKRIIELEKENEQLKARITYLERKIQRERASAIKEHEKWENEIQKENDQLKNEIKDLNDVLARYEEKELEE